MNSEKTVILTPSDLTRFANFLDDSIKRLRGKSRQMREAVTDAHAVWKDAKYDAFQKKLDFCLSNLDRFNSTGVKYAEFLRQKTSLANRFLNR